jgi:hypothetical protein
MSNKAAVAKKNCTQKLKQISVQLQQKEHIVRTDVEVGPDSKEM